MTIELLRDIDAQTPGPVPKEVLAYWRAKELKPAFSYLDVFNEEHDWAFSAAKIMRRDVLEAMRDELDRAQLEGVPFEQWKKQIEPRFQALGWWQRHNVQDPQTGKVVNINPPARLRTIFDTNMRTARAVGQWDRIQRTKRTRPYLLYLTGPSERHRPEHLAWHGLLLPVDDPFWLTHFPPCGWGCKCHTQSVSTGEASRLEDEGVLAPDPEPILDDNGNPTGHVQDKRVAVRRTAPTVTYQMWTNKRTGRVDLVPNGVDPGFHHLPGEGRRQALAGASSL